VPVTSCGQRGAQPRVRVRPASATLCQTRPASGTVTGPRSRARIRSLTSLHPLPPTARATCTSASNVSHAPGPCRLGDGGPFRIMGQQSRHNGLEIVGRVGYVLGARLEVFLDLGVLSLLEEHRARRGGLQGPQVTLAAH